MTDIKKILFVCNIFAKYNNLRICVYRDEISFSYKTQMAYSLLYKFRNYEVI